MQSLSSSQKTAISTALLALTVCLQTAVAACAADEITLAGQASNNQLLKQESPMLDASPSASADSSSARTSGTSSGMSSKPVNLLDGSKCGTAFETAVSIIGGSEEWRSLHYACGCPRCSVNAQDDVRFCVKILNSPNIMQLHHSAKKYADVDAAFFMARLTDIGGLWVRKLQKM